MKKVKLTAKRITYWMEADCETEVLMNEGDIRYLEDVTRVCPIKGHPFVEIDYNEGTVGINTHHYSVEVIEA